jgi:8-oxo-dGTP pyrophosphatase MutT (NUDIX family)
MLLIFNHDGEAWLILTVRTQGVRHAGQVSLPGGVVDEGETFEEAALREAKEEIGLSADSVRVLGLLSPVDIPVSGFRLHPVVAISPGRPHLQPSDLEVARILEVPIDTLMTTAMVERHTIVRDGRPLPVPAFLVDGLHIWGATAMVLAEFLSLLGWNGPAG